MTRKLWLALTVPGVFLVLVAGSGLAGGRGHSHESVQPGASMTSEFGTMGENWVPTGSSGERLEFSDYGREEALETGRLPAGGRGHSHKSIQPGESMSSEFGTMGENWVPSGSSGERLEFSDYGREAALETGRLPEREVRSETIVIFGHDVDGQLREGSVPGGP